MREALKGFAALAVAGLGFYVVVANAKHLTTPLLGFSGGLIVLALALAFRTDLEAILDDALKGVRAWRAKE